MLALLLALTGHVSHVTGPTGQNGPLAQDGEACQAGKKGAGNREAGRREQGKQGAGSREAGVGYPTSSRGGVPPWACPLVMPRGYTPAGSTTPAGGVPPPAGSAPRKNGPLGSDGLAGSGWKAEPGPCGPWRYCVFGCSRPVNNKARRAMLQTVG